ncbi:hypothetical protein B0H10DRAFT_2083024 [Mycena sp. CBHHK59/15]|nr:hypothetical protein B0H10DRAFT_2083024 [Mycena sp. CBHHK59/15]
MPSCVLYFSSVADHSSNCRMYSPRDGVFYYPVQVEPSGIEDELDLPIPDFAPKHSPIPCPHETPENESVEAPPDLLDSISVTGEDPIPVHDEAEILPKTTASKDNFMLLILGPDCLFIACLSSASCKRKRVDSESDEQTELPTLSIPEEPLRRSKRLKPDKTTTPPPISRRHRIARSCKEPVKSNIDDYSSSSPCRNLRPRPGPLASTSAELPSPTSNASSREGSASSDSAGSNFSDGLDLSESTLVHSDTEEPDKDKDIYIQRKKRCPVKGISNATRGTSRRKKKGSAQAQRQKGCPKSSRKTKGPNRSSDQPFCLPCNKSFTRRHGLNRHLETAKAHRGDAIKCDKCHAALSRPDALRRHMRDVHGA